MVHVLLEQLVDDRQVFAHAVVRRVLVLFEEVRRVDEDLKKVNSSLDHPVR